MVIVTVETASKHALKMIVERESRGDCYVECKCGYKGPSHEVGKGVDGRAEARNDLQLHIAAEQHDLMYRVSLRVRAHDTAESVKLLVSPEKTWRIAADQQERIEKERASKRLVSIIHSTDPIPIKGFELKRRIDEHSPLRFTNMGGAVIGTIEFNRFSPACTPGQTVCGAHDPYYCQLASAVENRCGRDQ